MGTMPSPQQSIANYVGNADEFPVLREWDFFNHAAVSPLPRRASDALRWYADRVETHVYIDSHFYKAIEELRTSAARMINASPDEVAFVKNTSEGIATVANSIDWQPGDRIVTTNIEFPANLFPWMDVSRRHGVELVTMPGPVGSGGVTPIRTEQFLAAADHPRTRLLSISHVQYSTGQRHDLAALGRFCRARGILFCVDAIQSLGALPVDVRGMNIDYLAADGHKWLLGPEGAGIFFCRRELIERTRPALVGWMNVVDHLNYGKYDFTLKSDARRFECGTHNVPGLLALKGAVDLLGNVGIDAIAARIRTLTDRLTEGLRQRGFGVISPRGDAEWSGIVSFTSPEGNAEGVWKELRTRHKIELAVREGRLRASPHFYDTEEQIDRLVETLNA
jgi:cysteine desulfurase/selenocysteine lyase